MGERHVFQPGAMGGLEPDDYLHGSPEVAEFLERHGSHRRRWNSPAPEADRPETEWGFEPALREEVERFAQENGSRIRRILFEEPQDLSPLVADLCRWWYERRGLVSNRLLVESFIVMEPWWALRTGSVSFWMKFNVRSSADALESYFDGPDALDEIRMMLFPHGTVRWRDMALAAA